MRKRVGIAGRIARTLATALALCAAAPAFARDGAGTKPSAEGTETPLPPRRPLGPPAEPVQTPAPSAAPTAPAPKSPAPKTSAPTPPAPGGAGVDLADGEAAGCFVELTALEVDFVKVEAPAAPSPGCGVVAPVRVRSVATREGPVRFEGEPLVACASARAAARFLRDVAAPLAKGATGSAMNALTISGYECRPRNRVAGAKTSAHGLGLAFDIASFGFADGTRLQVGASGPADKARFFAGLRKAACGYFTTVLGPGADSAHATHLHLDVEAHGSSGYARICQ